MGSLTTIGERVALFGNASITPTVGGIALVAASLRMFTSASVPAKGGVLGVDFVEFPTANGYVVGGISLVASRPDCWRCPGPCSTP